MARQSLSKVLLFHWKQEEVGELIRALKTAGYAALHNSRQKPPTRKEIAQSGAVAAIIDLSRLPSHGRYAAAWLRGSKSTRHLPLVFVDGDAAKVKVVQQQIPDAVYTSCARIGPALKGALRNPPLDPVIPRGMMESAPGRTTAQKLGIREGSAVRVIDPPADYRRVIGVLPKDASFGEDGSAPAAVCLWFVGEPAAFRAALRTMRRLAASTRLWIVWRKGRRDGFNGNVVREGALSVGLVDYKICSLDAVWSGMAFAVKKVGR
jgi:hypothetical protein